jgi:hypothetical protein
MVRKMVTLYGPSCHSGRSGTFGAFGDILQFRPGLNRGKLIRRSPWTAPAPLRSWPPAGVEDLAAERRIAKDPIAPSNRSRPRVSALQVLPPPRIARQAIG